MMCKRLVDMTQEELEEFEMAGTWQVEPDEENDETFLEEENQPCSIPYEEEQMNLHQIDIAMATIQEEIDWIEECGVMQDIPLPKKLEMIRRRQELQEELDMLAEGKAMLQ